MEAIKEAPKKKSYWILAAKIILSILVLLFVFYKVDFSKIIVYLNETNLVYLFLAFVAFLVSKVVSAFRLNMFYRRKGVVLSNITNVKLNFLAMFYGLFIPGIGADGYRVYWLKQNLKLPIKSSITISLLDRLSGLVALLWLMILFFYLNEIEHPIKRYAFLAVPISILVFYFLVRFFFNEYSNIITKLLLISLLVQAMQVACIWFIIQSIHIHIHQIGYIFIFLLTSLAFIIPVFGFRESAFIFGANWFGLDMEVSAAMSILFYICLALTSLVGLYYFFLPHKIIKQEKNTIF